METTRRPDGIRELPVVGGHLALDFANTVDDPLGPQRWDHIQAYPDLLVWSVRVGALPDRAATMLRRAAEADPRAAAGVVKRAAGLRDALNATFGAVAVGDSPGAGWADLRPYVTDAIANADVLDAGPLTWAPTEPAAPLWPVADAAYRLLTGRELGRLKRCVGCPWLFLDRSKNGSRRWCSMRYCGTDEKVRRYVRKRASGAFTRTS
jgi:predicted RNA-binding Zn ribbon-like protein